MTYTSEEAWEPVDTAGSFPHSNPVDSTFLHDDDLDALDAYLAERATRSPIGFAPKEIRP